MRLPEEVEQAFIALQEERRVRLEGNILKMLETDSEAFQEYIQNGLAKDDELRKKRLEITRQVQDQNKKLQQKAEENDKLMDEIKQALADADQAKEDALNDLDLM